MRFDYRKVHRRLAEVRRVRFEPPHVEVGRVRFNRRNREEGLHRSGESV